MRSCTIFAVLLLLQGSIAGGLYDNYVVNPSFELRNLFGAIGWKGVPTYDVDTLISYSGLRSIRVTSLTTLTVQGAYQVVPLNQEAALPIKISGWSKALLAGGIGDNNYAVSGDVLYQDGTWHRHVAASFPTGTHDFIYSETTFYPAKPIKEVWLYCLFAEHFGTVWFDSVGLTHVDEAYGSGDYNPESGSSSDDWSGWGTSGGFSMGSTSTSGVSRLTTTTSTAAPTISLGMRYLVLSNTPDDVRLGVINLTLNSVGMAFDVFYFGNGSSMVGKSLELASADMSYGKYSAIIACDNEVSLDTNQAAQIFDYQITFGVKYLVLYMYPTGEYGVSIASSGATISSGNLMFEAAAAPWTKGYPAGVMINATADIYKYPCVITNSSMATPAVSVTFAPGETFVAAAFVNINGTSVLQFYIDQATWAFSSIALGPFWLQWLNNGLYLGVRRVVLTPQVDDLFMESATYDTNNHTEMDDEGFRITSQDFQFVADWQDAFNKKCPTGSNFALTFAFNGETVVDEYGGYKTDPLYLLVKKIQSKFFFETHTWSHPELDNLTYAEVTQELAKNYVMAQDFFSNVMTGPNWSNISMVTPSISGLLSPEPLRALYDFGIINVVGDSSRKELLPEFAYHGLYTNTQVNGFAGVYIVPRQDTEIYYFSSNVAEEESCFNFRYNSYYGRDMNLTEIMDLETIRTLNLLLSYRHDPYMFHQANLAQFTYNGIDTTMITYWADGVLDALNQYSTLPVLSYKHDDLAQLWKDREARDNCSFDATMFINAQTRQVTSVEVSSGNACTFAITGLDLTGQSLVTMETYGPDTTAWISMTTGAQHTFTPHVATYL